MDVNITRRKRRRVQRDGSIKHQVRFICQWNDGGRNQRFFASRQHAAEFRSQLLKGLVQVTREPTMIGELVDRWLEGKRLSVRSATITAYGYYARNLEPLRATRVDKLTTRAIREWYEEAAVNGEIYSVNRALSILRAVLALSAEASGTRPVPMPDGLNRKTVRKPKSYLALEQVKIVIASGDLYVAWPFLTGTRISEQLGLLWEDVDFDAGVISIGRTQEKKTGRLIDSTKTESGTRKVPMGETLRRMLIDWRTKCPSQRRVFPAPNGGTLLYSNFLHRIWRPALMRMGLPVASIHSARASFISMLQAGGVELAVAAKLAGHKTPTVTLRYYTHSLRDGRDAMNALDETCMLAAPGGPEDAWET